MKNHEKGIQYSKKLSKKQKEKLLNQQNRIRKKYGLRPLKRIHIETFLSIDDNYRSAPKRKYIPNKNGGMYQ